MTKKRPNKGEKVYQREFDPEDPKLNEEINDDSKLKALSVKGVIPRALNGLQEP